MNIDNVLDSIRCRSQFIYVVTDEEDQFLAALNERIANKKGISCQVFNPAIGMVPVKDLVESWTKNSVLSAKVRDLNEALTTAYSETVLGTMNIYVFQDPEHAVGPDAKISARRVLNEAHHLNNNHKVRKHYIFLGSRLSIHSNLQRYIEVIRTPNLTQEEISAVMNQVFQWDDVKTSNPKTLNLEGESELAEAMEGMTSFEVQSLTFKTLKKHHSLNPVVAEDYRRSLMKKTDLLSFMDVSDCTFETVGGAQKFKEWAEKHKSSWSPEGQAYGLKPPRGVLMMGVWGCGKSLSVKALGNAWNLPVVKFDLGKMRGSMIGQSEENVSKVVSIIEAISPCIVFVDEAEKTFSGLESSGKTDSGVTGRMISTISTWLQESKAQFCFAMTANNINTLPIEFTRRVNERFFFDLPDEEDRIDILKIHLRKRNQPTDSMNLARLADDARLMVGSEIEQAVEAALIEAFHAKIPHISEELLSLELRRKPRIYKTMQDDVSALLAWVGYDDEVKDGIRARFASGKRNLEQ